MDGADIQYVTPAEVVTTAPTNAEHPALYERAVLILGILAAACIAGMVALAVMGRDGIDALGTLAGVAIGALAALLTPRG